MKTNRVATLTLNQQLFEIKQYFNQFQIGASNNIPTVSFCLTIGNNLEQQIETEVAITWWEQSLILYPLEVAFYKKICAYYIRVHAIQKTIDTLNHAISIFPKEPWFLNQLITFYIRLEEFEKGLKEAIRFIDKFPASSFGYFKKIQLLLMLKRKPAALDVLKIEESKLNSRHLLQIYNQLGLYYSIDKLCKQELAKEKDTVFWLTQQLRIALVLGETKSHCKELFEKLISHPNLSSRDFNALLPVAKMDVAVENYLLSIYDAPNASIALPPAIRDYLAVVKSVRQYANRPLTSLHPCSTTTVDLVYTWADMSDSAFLEKFKQANGFSPSDSNNGQHNEQRYTNNEEIKFSLQTVKAFFPEVNHIYIVTNDQTFDLSFLDPIFQQKITFINQEDLMPKNSVISSVFNSNLIETFLWKIPNLAETFVYCCDDYFFGAPFSVKEHVFNKDQVPYAIVGPATAPDLSFLDALLAYAGETTKYKAYQHNAYRLYLKQFGEVPAVQDLHLPVILRKTACKEAFELFAPTWKETFFNKRLRTNDCYYTLLMYNWYAIKKGYQQPADSQLYKKNSLLINNGLVEEHLEILKAKRPLFFCINFLPDKESKAVFKELAASYLSPPIQVQVQKNTDLAVNPIPIIEQIKLDFEAKKYQQVITKALEAINNNQANQWIVRFLILAYHKTNQWDLAEPHCYYLEKEYPEFEHNKSLLAETYQYSGRVKKALPIWEEAIASNAKISVWQLRLAQCHHQLKHANITINLLEKLLNKSEVLPQWLVINSLHILLIYKQTQLVDLHIGKIATTHPQYFHLQAIGCKIQKQWSNAASLYASAYALNKKKNEWKLEQIRCSIKAGVNRDIWLRELKSILEKETLPNSLLGQVGDILVAQREWDDLAYLLKRMSTAQFKYHELSARLFMYRLEWEPAIAAWEQAVTLNKKIPIWWEINIIRCHHQLGNKYQVEQLCATLLTSKSLTDNYLKQIANFLIHNNAFSLAQSAIDTRSEEGKEESIFLSARLAFKQENIEKALCFIEEFKAKEITDERLVKEIYALELTINRTQEDWEVVKKNGEFAIMQFPDYWPLYSSLLPAYVKLNEQEKYANLIEEAYQRFQKTTPHINTLYSKFTALRGEEEKSLLLLETAYKKNSRLLLPLLKRYIQDGEFSKFLQLASSDNLPKKQKIEVLTELINTYIIMGHYQSLPSLIDTVKTLIPADYTEVRLLAVANMKIIKLYEILNAPTINVSTLLNKVEKQQLKKYLENCLDTFEPKEVLLNLIEGPFVKITPTKSFIINLVKQYLDKSQYDATVWWNTNENPSQAFALASYLKKRITEKIPTSFIRLGDGEGNYLDYADYFQQAKQEDQKKIQYIWWGEAKLGQDGYSKQVIETFRRAIHNADILGVTPERRLFNTLHACLNNGQLNHSVRGTLGVMYSTMYLPFKAKVLTSCHVHTDFEMWDCYHYLLKDVETIHVISCHSELVEYLKERFGIRTVHLYQIPGEQKYQKMFGYEDANEHFPTIFKELSEALAKKSKGQLFLVAAGFISKIYCHIIKQNGGIGIDIGSVVDQWMGHCTRTYSELGHYSNGIRFDKQISSSVELPLKGQMVKTNHYCDRQLPIERQPEIPKPIPFLITGHPRTGTTYVSQIFTSLGCPIGYEKLESEGMASWLHAVHNLNTPLFGKKNIGKYTISRYELEPEHLLLLVGDPKEAIPAIILENRVNLSYNYRRFHILHERGIDLDDYDSYLEKAIVSYIEWIAIIETQKPNAILRLEYLEEDVRRYFEQESIPYKKDYELAKISKYNSTKEKYGTDKPVLSIQDYLKINPIILRKLYDFCGKYGYSTDFMG